MIVGAVADLVRIRADLDDGRRRLDQLDLATLRTTGLEATLAGAADSLADAAERAETSPFLGLAGTVPVLDDQVAALRDLTGAADTLGVEARRTGSAVSTALDEAGARPGARVELLDVVAAELARVETVAAGIDIGAEGWLLPPLRGARADIASSLDSVPSRIGPLQEQVGALRTLLAGPTRYLVMVGNNAEMRAGAGMPLSAGLATISNGDIDLGDFTSTVSEMYEPNPTGRFNADIPDALADTYPRWLIGKDFPETAVVPDFPTTAPIYADIAADTQGWEVAGAIHIDALALAELLTVVGPVEIAGTAYTAETAPQLVLNQPYLDFDTIGERAERLDAQSELANALFEAIGERNVDLLDVVAALQRAAGGRHLMAWSRDPVLQDLYDSFGASGTVASFDTLVSFQNTAANKLDWYIRPTVAVEAEPLVATDEWLVTLTATITNPDGIVTSDYIDGLRPELPDGLHRTLLTVQVPDVATGIDLRDRTVTEFGEDGISTVVGTRFTVPRGDTEAVTVRFRLPANFAGLRVLPSARVAPVPWTFTTTRSGGIVDGATPTFTDATAFTALFGRFPDPAPTGPWQASALAGVLVALGGVAMLAAGARRDQSDTRGVRLARIDAQTGAALLLAAVVLAGAAAVIAG